MTLHDPQEGDELVGPCSICALAAVTGTPAPTLLDRHGYLLDHKGGAGVQELYAMFGLEGFDLDWIEAPGTIMMWLRKPRPGMHLVIVTKHALVTEGNRIANYHVRQVLDLDDPWLVFSRWVDRTRIRVAFRITPQPTKGTPT